jgi:2-oxoglutarate dehydrogenase E2 component (dihydrolipoamide succinyltransferase)
MNRLLRLSCSLATPGRLLASSHRTFHVRVQRTAAIRPSRFFSGAADFTEVVPPLGDSISNATVASLLKNEGDYVQEKEVVAVFETDKVSVDIRASKSGVIKSILAKTGDLLNVGQDFFVLDTSASAPSGATKAA